MPEINDLIYSINRGDCDTRLLQVYGQPDKLGYYHSRLCQVLDGYTAFYGNTDTAMLFSAPGRTEIGGNHTDHQRGSVLAASVDLDVIACVAINDTNIIRIKSDGFDEDIIDLASLNPIETEKNTSAALIRGIAAAANKRGFKVQGFNAYTISNVLKGSGLSSSAAFEVLVGVIIDKLFCNMELGSIEIAKIGQYAENVFFGKPCGLMDQMASSVGGIIAIDFKIPEQPSIEKIDFDFNKAGYKLCIIDTGGDHANLTNEYAAIPKEMKKVAKLLGGEVLSDIAYDDFCKNIVMLRKKAGDRAVLRAIHFYADNLRAKTQAELLRKKDFNAFLSQITQSGRSSYMYLQNVFCAKNPKTQPVSVALALCDTLLSGNGAYRVHGGGFAGTIQAFVPTAMADDFKQKIDAVLGKNMCHMLSIRPVGGTFLF